MSFFFQKICIECPFFPTFASFLKNFHLVTLVPLPVSLFLFLFQILCLYKGKVCRFQELRQRNSCDGDDVEELKQYLKLVGNKAAATMILYRG